MGGMGRKFMTYDFEERLMFSQGAKQNTDIETIKKLLDGCAEVVPAPIHLDKIGVDYIAELRRGAKVFIDAKTRSSGCSRYWADKEPELAIEIWSCMPGGKFDTKPERAKTGWTLDEAKITDMILYTFDKKDCNTAFLLPFQPLRIAARRNVKDWLGKYKRDIQTSNKWQSLAVFVPAREVIKAITETFQQEQ